MKYLDHIADLPPVEIDLWRVERNMDGEASSFNLRQWIREGNASTHSESLIHRGPIRKNMYSYEDALYPEAYEGIDEPTDELPYLFDNDYGDFRAGSIANRTVMFYKLGFKGDRRAVLL